MSQSPKICPNFGACSAFWTPTCSNNQCIRDASILSLSRIYDVLANAKPEKFLTLLVGLLQELRSAVRELQRQMKQVGLDQDRSSRYQAVVKF